MKKIFAMAAIAVAAFCGTASAQTGYIGGQVGYWHETKNGTTTNQFSILPEIGYNLNKTWAVGTTIGYDYTHTCGAKQSLHLFEFNPYARFTYFRTSNNLVQLFIDGGAGIGLGVADNDGNSKTAVSYNIGLKPGVAFNLTDKFSVVAHLGMLGYEGANKNAKRVGYPTGGGIRLKTTEMTLGFYYNF